MMGQKSIASREFYKARSLSRRMKIIPYLQISLPLFFPIKLKLDGLGVGGRTEIIKTITKAIAFLIASL